MLIFLLFVCQYEYNSINQSINQSISESIIQSIFQLICQSPMVNVEHTVGTRFHVLEGTRVFWTLNPSVVKSNSITFIISIFKKTNIIHHWYTEPKFLKKE